METSQFDNTKIVTQLLKTATIVNTCGATCDTFMTKLHGKRVLIKRLKEEHRYNPRYRLAIQKEFEASFALEHKALPRYLSMTEDAIVMDYIDGLTLSQFIKANPTFFDNKYNINRFLNQLLNCLSYLHSQSIVHLDLKPDNIMLTRVSNDVKVIDFGFCYTDSYNDTKGHNIAFAAPEQLSPNNSNIDARTDIYAVGKILEYILNNRKTRAKYNHIIKTATKKEETQRYQTAEEFAKALNNNHFYYRPLFFLIVIATVISVGIILNYSNQIGSNNQQPILHDTITTQKKQLHTSDSLYNDNITTNISHIQPQTKKTIQHKNTKVDNINEDLPDISDFTAFMKNNIQTTYIEPLYKLITESDNKISINSEAFSKLRFDCENKINNMLQNFLINKSEEYKRRAYANFDFYVIKFGYRPLLDRLEKEGYITNETEWNEDYFKPEVLY